MLFIVFYIIFKPGYYWIVRQAVEIPIIYRGLKNFSGAKIYVRSHEMSIGYDIISTENTNVPIVKFIRFRL